MNNLLKQIDFYQRNYYINTFLQRWINRLLELGHLFPHDSIYILLIVYVHFIMHVCLFTHISWLCGWKVTVNCWLHVKNTEFTFNLMCKNNVAAIKLKYETVFLKTFLVIYMPANVWTFALHFSALVSLTLYGIVLPSGNKPFFWLWPFKFLLDFLFLI